MFSLLQAEPKPSRSVVYNQQSLGGNCDVKRAEKRENSITQIASILPEVSINQILSHFTGESSCTDEHCLLPGTVGFFCWMSHFLLLKKPVLFLEQ